MSSSQAGKSGSHHQGNQASSQAAKPDPLQALKAAGERAEEAIDSAKMSDLERRLQELERQLAEEQRKNEELMAQEAGRRISLNDKPYAGEGGYVFRVGPDDPDKHPGLETIEVKATDESEAKRWYCNSHDWPLKSGLVIDPVTIRIRVICIDPARQRSIVLQKTLGVIRSKLDRGLALTPAEEKVLEQNLAAVHNY